MGSIPVFGLGRAPFGGRLSRCDRAPERNGSRRTGRTGRLGSAVRCLLFLMAAIILPLFPLPAQSRGGSLAREGKRVSLVLAQYLVEPLSGELRAWEGQAKAEGYEVRRLVVAPGARVAGLRAMLTEEWKAGSEGAFLVGDLPYAWFENETEGRFPYVVEYYLNDLTGVWEDKDGDGWFDGHADEDARPEIYVGRLQASNLGGDELSLLRGYFARNLAFRQGRSRVPIRSVSLTSDLGRSQRLEGLLPGQAVREWSKLTSKGFLDRLGSESGRFLHVIAHGYATGFSFEADGGHVRSTDLARLRKQYEVLLLHNCGVGDFSTPFFTAGTYLLVNSEALAAFAVTKEAAAYWFDTRFAAGYLGLPLSLGQAMKRFQGRYGGAGIGDSDEREFIILGDPTLVVAPGYERPEARAAAARLRAEGSTASGGLEWKDFNDDWEWTAESVRELGGYVDLHYGNLRTGRPSWGQYGSRPFGDFKDDVHATTKADDFAVFSFHGAALELYAETAPDHGRMELVVDGGPPQVLELQGTRAGQKLLFSSAWRENGRHEVQIRNLDEGRWGVVDRFRVGALP